MASFAHIHAAPNGEIAQSAVLTWITDDNVILPCEICPPLVTYIQVNRGDLKRDHIKYQNFKLQQHRRRKY